MSESMPESMPEKAIPTVRTLVQLLGGHTTVVRGIAPPELHVEIEEARISKTPFYFLQDAWAHPERANGVCIDPSAVVALIRID
jgi:hypothetical protein